MYLSNAYARTLGAPYYRERAFGAGAAHGSWDFSSFSHVDYLGVPVFSADREEMPSRVLGMTNGRRIVFRKNLPQDMKDFVLMHEEEHVKDMFATEHETDERALRRFAAKHGSVSRRVRKLMKKRHGTNDRADCDDRREPDMRTALYRKLYFDWL